MTQVQPGSGAELARNVRRIARLEIPGGGQVSVDGNFVYVGHMKPPHGTTIIDVSDPAHPKPLHTIMLPDAYSHTHKARVAGDLMIVNVEQNNRHLMRRGARLPDVEATLAAGLRRPAADAEIAAELKVKPGDVPMLREGNRRGYADGGFRVYDIADRSRPRLLSYVKTCGFGVHRFDMDARYAYISTEMEGYVGNILVIYDLAKPEAPEEVSRWWLPGQHVAGGEMPTWEAYKNRLHHALRTGDELWAAVWNAGLRVIDISDIRHPRTVGEYNYHPPFPEPTHTVLPVRIPVAGRRIAVAVDEEHEHIPGQPHAGLWVFDVTDLGNIRPLSLFQVSELDSPWSRRGRFGAHQFQEHLSDTLVYVTWFAGGLRIVDVADPTLPREVGHFIPEPGAGQTSPQSNDVDVDKRGLIYLLDRDQGLDILEYAGAR
ncbi:MAG: RNA polymerase subunit sigma-70 [Betaproteobacteria bacterium RIFCSPLOWO2_12_FULL_63_13]|nr:MAG: RNA polymerase subunit sigma-70 [Betaproteobacteria bacterium RIFCSPLOWO2_12_FULL_63_13]